MPRSLTSTELEDVLVWIVAADGGLVWANGPDAERAHALASAPADAQHVELRSDLHVLARVVAAPGIGLVGVALPVDGSATEHAGRVLTRRQEQVLQLLADGHDTAQIAARLRIAPETARNHIRALLARLGAHSRLEAVVIGIRRGLV